MVDETRHNVDNFISWLMPRRLPCQDGAMPLIVKYGGNAMTDDAVQRRVARDIAALAQAGQEPVVVHGGGPFIAQALAAAGIESRFVRGLRVTSAESLPIVEAALTLLNKRLSQQIGRAIGLTGRDCKLLVAEALDAELGFVGRVTAVNRALLEQLLTLKLTPVVACLASDEAGSGVYNVNADSVAGVVAGALAAPVVFLTNVAGVLDDPTDPTSLLSDLSESEIRARIEDGRIAGGMIPKVEAALEALEHGARYAVITDGREEGVLARALKGQSGTRVHLGAQGP
jgi:acetylglutamate kinase